MDQTQVRLSTGREINQAIDSPYRYFTSNLLQSRADDLDSLNHDLNLASMTLQAATNGMEAMRDLLDQAKALLQQSLAESDGFQRINYLDQYNEVMSQIENTAEDSGYKGKNLLGGAGNDLKVIFNEEYTSQLLVDAVDYTDVSNIGLDKNMYAGDNGTDTVTISPAAAITADTKMVDIVGYDVGDEIEFVGQLEGDRFGAIEITDTMTVDEFMTTINVSVDNITAELSATTGSIDFTYATESVMRHLKEPSTDLTGSEVNVALGGLNVGALTTGTADIKPSSDLNGLDGFVIASGDSIDFTVTDNDGNATLKSFTYGIDGTNVQDLIDFVNDNVDGVQLYVQENGAGIDSLNFTATSDVASVSYELQDTSTTGVINAGGGLFTGSPATVATGGATDAQGNAWTAAGSNVVGESDFFADTKLNSLLLRVRSAELDVRQQITSYSTDLTLIQRRMDFSEMMINTLELGATDLVIADTNEEGANMLTLQTRQQLSNTALSLASQAEQGVLRLFG